MPDRIQVPFSVKIVQNPWEHTVPTMELEVILATIAAETAERLVKRYRSGLYEVPALAIVILDPTAPPSRESEQAVLAVVIIGDDAVECVPNAFSKAFEHRDHGIDNGAMVMAHSHLLPDGAFRHGHSACVDGTIGGASALTTVQDRAECTIFLAQLNLAVQERRTAWETNVGNPSHADWFCNENLPEERVKRAIHKDAPALLHIGHMIKV